MNLQSLQTNLSTLIKSRQSLAGITDDYLEEVATSDNLLLIKKIALWWRKIQVEQYCVLTCNLLKITYEFETSLAGFITHKAFSSFREEVGNQFLEYIIASYPDSLLQSVASFESAVIKLKIGEEIETSIEWPYEPYSIISGLLRHELHDDALIPGKYLVNVSYKHKEALFQVETIQQS